MADGALLTTDYSRLLRTEADGKNPTVLASDPAAGILHPSVCGAQYIVFPWAYHGGTNSIGIWRLNTDGSHPTQLTDGVDDGWAAAVCSVNQSWVYFARDVTNLWRVPLDGSGKPEAIAVSAIAGAFQTGRG